MNNDNQPYISHINTYSFTDLNNKILIYENYCNFLLNFYNVKFNETKSY